VLVAIGIDHILVSSLGVDEGVAGVPQADLTAFKYSATRERRVQVPQFKFIVKAL
jgi:hypothetical protein